MSIVVGTTTNRNELSLPTKTSFPIDEMFLSLNLKFQLRSAQIKL